ncbi:helix-turn-helix transcriptional regulator [Sinimarinibacterium thermocellulolyticum]|uniref:WYL domain-containing protein n=1 Tax=Sinimarinibacterium thermocellulolyticum TaxID=3170016 RepID=A0ABV2A7K1_9GAMM
MDPFERIWQLHRLFTGRRTVLTAQDLRQQLRCSRATLNRSLAFLRDALGAPLIHDRELGGYRYETGSRFELPGMWFSAEELAALLLLDEILGRQPLGMLAEILGPFRSRLEALAQQRGVGVPQWRARLRLLRMAARPAGDCFPIVAGALAQRRRLRIQYHARHDDQLSTRTVSPQRLTLYRDNWYLDGWCHARCDLRTFALDRIIAAEALDETALDIAEDRLDRTLATSYGIYAGEPTATAVLSFSPRAARWVAAETWHPQQQDQSHQDGSLIRRLPYHRSEELVMDLMRHGPDVQVLEPAELREAVLQRLRAALDAHAATARRPPPVPTDTGSSGEPVGG